MNKIFEQNISNRIEIILDNLNNMFENIAEMKAGVLLVKQLLKVESEDAQSANKPL